MSLDISLMKEMPVEIFSQNITHNLNRMAREAGIYEHLWRPEELNITKAKELIVPLSTAIQQMEYYPARFIAFNPENGWGSYDGFLNAVKKYLAACIENPDATISISR